MRHLVLSFQSETPRMMMIGKFHYLKIGYLPKSTQNPSTCEFTSFHPSFCVLFFLDKRKDLESFYFVLSLWHIKALYCLLIVLEWIPKIKPAWLTNCLKIFLAENFVSSQQFAPSLSPSLNWSYCVR